MRYEFIGRNEFLLMYIVLINKTTKSKPNKMSRCPPEERMYLLFHNKNSFNVSSFRNFHEEDVLVCKASR